MDIGIGMIIFIVFVVISIAQKIKERADLARARGQQPQSKPGEMSERARQMIHGTGAAMRDEDAIEAPSEPPRRGPADPAKALMKALLGVEEEEAEWAPDAPAPRPELPRRVQQGPAPPPIRRQVVAHHVESRVQHEPVHEGATTREEGIRFRQAQEVRHRQREAQQRGREEREDLRARSEQRQRRKKAPVRPTASARRQKRERLFAGAHEVRKAIVFAEILGPPKAFKDR